MWWIISLQMNSPPLGSELSVRILRLFQQQHTGMVYGCQLFGITDVDTDIHRTTSQTDGQTQTPEAARLLSQLRRLVLLKLRSHYNISHQRWISWPVSVNQCDKCKYVYYTTALLSFFWLPAAQSGWLTPTGGTPGDSLDWRASRQKNKLTCTCLLKVSQCVCGCVVVFVCVTSGAAFLFCSPTPRFSRLRLASKHSGHNRLVLLSKVFEHFAQMACRRTELLTVNWPKEIFHLFPTPTSLCIPSFLHPINRCQDFSRSICAHRSTGLAVVFALGEIEALVAAFTRLLLFVLFPGTLLEK